MSSNTLNFSNPAILSSILPAVTGKANPQEYFDIIQMVPNIQFSNAKNSGKDFFSYISTIAVKYPDISHYYYAQSKKLAEDVVEK